jgi:hypothetical protein
VITKPAGEEERAEMNDKKKEHDGAADKGDAGRNGACCGPGFHGVILVPDFPVCNPQLNSKHNMQQKSGEKANLDCPDDEVRCHELGIGVKCDSAISPEEQKISREMHNEEGTKEQPREAH